MSSDTYRVPPKTGPTTKTERASALATVYDVWIWRAVLLAAIIALTLAGRSCTYQWKAQEVHMCETACAMSNDEAYRNPEDHRRECMCLTSNGSRYSPWDNREVCE